MKANYGKLWNAQAHASTDEIFSEVLDADPGATGVTAWCLDTRGGTLTPYYIPIGSDDTGKIALDGTSGTDDYRVTVSANVLARCTIAHGFKRIIFGFTPTDATAGEMTFLDAFATGVKL